MTLVFFAGLKLSQTRPERTGGLGGQTNTYCGRIQVIPWLSTLSQRKCNMTQQIK